LGLAEDQALVVEGVDKVLVVGEDIQDSLFHKDSFLVLHHRDNIHKLFQHNHQLVLELGEEHIRYN
jgi:hypothetical protein